MAAGYGETLSNDGNRMRHKGPKYFVSKKQPILAETCMYPLNT